MIEEYINWIIANPIESILGLMVEYAIIMTLSTQRKLVPLAKLATLIFIPQNALVNIFVLSPMFADLPQEWLSTARFKRYKKLYELPINRNTRMEEWRYFFAISMCRYLNLLDKGHC